MQFTYQVSLDDDYTPGGDFGIEEEETAQFAAGTHAAYGVIVRAAGPVESWASLWGIVVETTDTGHYHDIDAITDDHLRGEAEGLAEEIEAGYLDKLIAKRDEINAMIQQMGGA